MDAGKTRPICLKRTAWKSRLEGAEQDNNIRLKNDLLLAYIKNVLAVIIDANENQQQTFCIGGPVLASCFLSCSLNFYPMP